MVDHHASPRYHSYLLRFWQERSRAGGVPVWRFSLEDPHTRIRHGFATLEELLAAMMRDMETTAGANALSSREGAQEGTMQGNGHAEDEVAIRAAIKAVEAGWNAGDGEAFAAPFADDADYVVVDGRYVKGREVIAQGHRRIFATIYKGSHNSATIRSIRLLRDDVAVAHVEWNLKFGQDETLREGRAVNTMILTRDDGAWRIAAFHNTPLVAAGA
jgi:uncharacterized protein (TIGR02246 family)